MSTQKTGNPAQPGEGRADETHPGERNTPHTNGQLADGPLLDKGLSDVAVNVFGKPYQTALSVLSLLKFSGAGIGRVFFQFEPAGSRFDQATPYAVAEYLGERAVAFQPEIWLKSDPVDPARLHEPAYRLAVRYQHAFENSRAAFLFTMHNDVMFTADIIGILREKIKGAFAIGQIGQCWSCPASVPEIVRESGLGDCACSPERYQDFRPDAQGLRRLYALAAKHNFVTRPYIDYLDLHYAESGWPLPECRVNEWACLVDLEQTRPLTTPLGQAMPFGALESCGPVCLDTASAWFRDISRQGLLARHFDISPLFQHWIGTAKMTEYKYLKAEGNARAILEKHFPDFVRWCRDKKNKMFI